MKKFALLAAFVPMFLSTGCDMFRALVGRPSPEVVNMQEKLETGGRLVDSLRASRTELHDELETANFIRVVDADVEFIDNNVGDLYFGVVRGRYYVMVGTFSRESNFENMVRTVLDAGYLPTGLAFRNGGHGVAVCPVDSRREAEYALIGVRKEDFCPEDAYIMYVK